MDFVILGSGTLEMDPDRGASGHLLIGDRTPSVLVDSGPGTIDRLARLGVSPLSLAAVLHSHLHLDHLSDLFPLLFQRCMGDQALSELVLSGAPGHEQRLLQIVKTLYPKMLQTRLAFHEIAPNGRPHPLPGTPYTVSAFGALHSQAPRVLRIEGSQPEPWSLAYSGDTALCPGLIEAARGVDWLVIECTTPDDQPRPGHLCPEDVATVVARAQPKGTALVHLSPAWRRPEDAAAVVRAHIGTQTAGEVPYIVGGRDGLALPLPWSEPYATELDPDRSLESL